MEIHVCICVDCWIHIGTIAYRYKIHLILIHTVVDQTHWN